MTPQNGSQRLLGVELWEEEGPGAFNSWRQTVWLSRRGNGTLVVRITRTSIDDDPVSRLNEPEKGKVGVTPKSPRLLASVTGTSAEFWMGWQTRRELWAAPQEFGGQPPKLGRTLKEKHRTAASNRGSTAATPERPVVIRGVPATRSPARPTRHTGRLSPHA